MPSERIRPAERTAASEPCSWKTSKGTTSARMKPRSKSVWILPAAWGARVPRYEHLALLSQLGKEVHFSAMEPETDGRGRSSSRGWDIGDVKQADPSAKVAREVLTDYITRGLTREERLVLILYYYEELTMAEIGLVLDLSESRVSQIHKDVLARLRQRFGAVSNHELVA